MKPQKECLAKRDLDKALDQVNRRNEIFKQEVVRQITDQLNQRLDKQFQETEKKIMSQVTTYTEKKMKQDGLRSITGQLNQQIDKQIQEWTKKTAVASSRNPPRSDSQTASKTNQVFGQLEKKIQDSEKRLTDKMTKMADMQKRELTKNISQQISVKTEKQMQILQERTSKSTEMAKKELVKQLKERTPQELKRSSWRSSSAGPAAKDPKKTTLPKTRSMSERRIAGRSSEAVKSNKAKVSPTKTEDESHSDTELLKQDSESKLTEKVVIKSGEDKEEWSKSITDRFEQKIEMQTHDLKQSIESELQEKQGELQNRLEDDFRQQLADHENVLKETLDGRVVQELQSLKHELTRTVTEQVMGELVQHLPKGDGVVQSPQTAESQFDSEALRKAIEEIAEKQRQDFDARIANFEAKQSELHRKLEGSVQQQLTTSDSLLKETLGGRFGEEMINLKKEMVEQVKGEVTKHHRESNPPQDEGAARSSSTSEVSLDPQSWRKILEETVERITEKQLQRFEARISSFEVKQDELQSHLEDGFRQQFANCENIWKETLGERLNTELQSLMKELVGKIFEQVKHEIIKYLQELSSNLPTTNGDFRLEATSDLSVAPETSRKIMEETVERITEKQLQMFEARISSFELKQDELQSHLEDGFRQQFADSERVWKETLSGRLSDELQSLMKELVGKIFDQVKSEIVKYLQELPTNLTNGYGEVQAGSDPELLEETIQRITERQFQQFEVRISSFVDAKNEIMKLQLSGIAAERINDEIAKFSQELQERRSSMAAQNSPPSARQRLENGLEGSVDDRTVRKALEVTEQQFHQFQEEISGQVDHKLKLQKEELLKYFDKNLNQLLDNVADESVDRTSLVDSDSQRPAEAQTGVQKVQMDTWIQKMEQRILDTKQQISAEVASSVALQKQDLLQSCSELMRQNIDDSLKSMSYNEETLEKISAQQTEVLVKRISEDLMKKLADQRKELMKYLDDHLNVLLDNEVTDSVHPVPESSQPKLSGSAAEDALKRDFERQIQSSRVKITMELTEKAETIKEQLLKHFEEQLGQVRSSLDQEKLKKILLDQVAQQNEDVKRSNEELQKRNLELVQELREKLSTQLIEEAALQRTELCTHINTRLNQSLDEIRVGFGKSGNAEVPRTLEDLGRLEAGYLERIEKVKEELSQSLAQQVQAANDAVFQYLRSPETEITKIISKYLIEQIQELQDKLSSQVNEKLELQRVEMLKNLEGQSAIGASVEKSSAPEVPSQEADHLGESSPEERGATVVISSVLPPSVEMKIDEVVKDIADQVNHQLEMHINQARVKIRDEIDHELNKLHKQAEEQAQAFSANQAEIKKLSAQLREDIQKSGRLRSMSASSEGVQRPEKAERYVDLSATPYVWRIAKFQQQLQDLKSEKLKKIESGLFLVRGTPLRARAELRLSSHSHWISLLIGFTRAKRPDSDDDNTPFLFSHRRTFTLMDQSNNDLKRDRVIIREPGFRDEDTEKWMKKRYGPVYFAPVDLLEGDSVYVEDDTILIKILLEPMSSLYRPIGGATSGDDGTLFWRIENYRSQKQAEVDGLIECLYSDYFFTGPKGYRLQIRAYLNGDEHSKSEYFSVFLYFRRGPWDDFLPCSFPHQTTFTVLDQSNSGDRRDIVKTMMQTSTEDKIVSGYGFREFALQSEIENPTYLKKDTLFIKVTVRPLPEEADDADSFHSLGSSQMYT